MNVGLATQREFEAHKHLVTSETIWLARAGPFGQ